MSRKYLLDCTASGAKWADDVHEYRCYLSKPLNPVSEVTGEDQNEP